MKKKLTSVLLFLAMSAGVVSAQTSNVTGKVIGEDGEPVIGASIIVKGTTVGTVTDFDGNFTLDVPSDGKQLVISYIGMKSKEVVVSPNVNVTLMSDTQNLDEVVVTAMGISEVNPESWTKNFRGFVMSKKRKKHGYAERLKYMHMLENGLSINHIHLHYGIGKQLLSSLWIRYQSEGYSGLIKKKNIKADYAFKLQILRDIEENHLTLVAASLKYDVSSSQISEWKRIARVHGYDALSIIRPKGRPPKNDMGRPRKKEPDEMTELELLQLRVKGLEAENALLKKVKALVEAREARLREIGRKPSKN